MPRNKSLLWDPFIVFIFKTDGKGDGKDHGAVYCRRFFNMCKGEES